jgi:crotonobetainyl-CoA:carnitine CoA-transferase CaiB-like acyl-CoA transferase
MMQANAWANADEAYDYGGRPGPAVADADCMGLHALYRLYRAAEGWVFLACLFDAEWQALCAATGRADLASDARFATADARRAHDGELAAELTMLFATRPADAWEPMLTAVHVACVRADVDSGQFFEEHPQAIANQLSVETEGPRVGRYTRHGGIAQFSDSPGRFDHGAFGGEHTLRIMDELGYTPEQVEGLRTKRVIDWEEVNRIAQAI